MGSTLQLLGMKQKIHLVKNENVNYFVCNDITVASLFAQALSFW